MTKKKINKFDKEMMDMIKPLTEPMFKEQEIQAITLHGTEEWIKKMCKKLGR